MRSRPAPQRRAGPAARPVELRFDPVDNRRLARLCGALDANLRQIESALDVGISRRGARFMVRGEHERATRAARALELFYERADADLSVDDVQLGLAEMLQGRTPAAALKEARKSAATGERPLLVTRRSELQGRTPHQVQYIENILAHDITFGIGPAGTGKTFLAVAMAVAALEAREVSRIILTRPAVEAGERLGFLPGDLQAKVDPYLRPLFDALYDMLDPERVNEYFERGVIEVAPLAFMRGRTLNDSFVILDEAQNTSPEQMKMFLTRLGFGSRMVVTGDITQIDLPANQRSGLIVVGEILGGLDDVIFIRFGSADVVRHELVQRIVAAYGAYSDRAERGSRE